MLVENQVIKQKWNNKNKEHYIGLGYCFTSIGDEFETKIEDLTKASKAKVLVKCDYCGAIVKKMYQTYIKQHHDKFGDACKDCQPKKNKLVCQDKYGVDNGSQLQSAKNKAKQTCLDKYGYDNASKAPEIIDKIQQTFLDKYGVVSPLKLPEVEQKRIQASINKFGTENPFASELCQQQIEQTNLNKYGVKYPSQSEEIKAKVIATNLERYGASYYSQTNECKEKVKSTNLERFGYESNLSSPEVRAKIAETLVKNGNCPTSKQQLQLCDMLKSIYGSCELNMPCGANMLDCVVMVDGIKIDVEYDGWYWHKDARRDRRRDEFVKSQGYKILRILSDRKVPPTEQIKAAVDELVNSDKQFIRIKMV